MEDWGTCLATGVEKLDPRRGSKVLEGLLQLCAPAPTHPDSDPDQDTSFVVCARLYALQVPTLFILKGLRLYISCHCLTPFL